MNPITGIALIRTAIGAGALVAPRASATLFNLDADASSPYVMRLFAAREIGLGVATLAAPTNVRTALVAGGIAIDASDAVAGYLALEDGEVSRVGQAKLMAPAVAAVAGAVVGLALSRRGI